MNPDACKDVMDRSRIPYESLQDIGNRATAVGLEELSLRKQLPLRQQAEKPVLKYNTSLSKAIHLFNPLEVNGGTLAKDVPVDPGVGAYSTTGLYYTGNAAGVSAAAAAPDVTTLSRRPEQQNNPYQRFPQSFHQKIRKSPTPTNPYVRPVSATEIAANINGEKSKRMIEAAAAVATASPEKYANGGNPSTLSRNSFLRPLSGISREKTDATKQTSTTATATHIPKQQVDSTTTSDSSSKRNVDNKSVKNVMFQFASTTSYKNPHAPHISRPLGNGGSSSASSSPMSQTSDKPLGVNSSYLSNKPYSETVKVIKHDSSGESHMPHYLSQNQLGAKQSSHTHSHPHSESSFTTSKVNKAGTESSTGVLKKMPVTNTLTGTVYYRKTSITESTEEMENNSSHSSQKLSTATTQPENVNNNVVNGTLTRQLSSLSLDQKSSSHSVASSSRPTFERSNASVQLVTKPPPSSQPSQKKTTAFPVSPPNQPSQTKKGATKESSVNRTITKSLSDPMQHKDVKSQKSVSSFSISNSKQSLAAHGTTPKGKAGQKVVEQRPMGDGAPSKRSIRKEVSMHVDGRYDDDDANGTDYDEDDDEDDDDFDDGEGFGDDDDVCSGTTVSGERLPGDGEASFDELDDEDDGLDQFEDNTSDGGSDGYSINSTSSLGRRASSGRPMTSGSVKDASTSTLLEDKVKSLATRPATSTTAVIIKPFFRHSMFKHIPPTINFVGEGEKTEQIQWDLRKLLKWKMSPITPLIVKTALARVGFRITKRNHDWLGCFGKHMKAVCFKPLREYQKLNHFPGSFQIGRKDRLWRNLSKLQLHYGKKEFNFFPQTYVLPCDLKLLKRAWEDGNSKQKWIIKPPASARGIGIKVISKWTQIPRRKPVIVQKYLSRPYLINDSKFDMRVYVYVSAYDPLRIYVYDDGLARFASCKYSSSMKSLSNKYMHLTNYSINKKNSSYQSNTDNNLCQGHKWSLKSLWNYMKRQGINTAMVWDSVKDLIVKTIISGDASINSMTKSNCRSRYIVHELFGFDILLDENLKPWILEVNISPSLHSNSQLDVNIKGGMIKDLMNIAGFKIPDERDVSANATSGDFSAHRPLNKYCMDKRLLTNQLAPDERAKHAYYCQKYQDEQVMQTILDTITPDDMRHLCEAIDEDSRKGNFQRLFPTPQTHRYLRYFEQPRYYNLLLDQWVLRYNRMEQRGILLLQSFCEEGIHLENPTSCNRHQWTPPNCSMASLRITDVRSLPGGQHSHRGREALLRMLSCGAATPCSHQKIKPKIHDIFDKFCECQLSEINRIFTSSPHPVLHWSNEFTQQVTSCPSAPFANYDHGSEPNIFIKTLSSTQPSKHCSRKSESCDSI